jgi:hypothetical protein
VSAWHGLINYIDTKAKCRHLKIFSCKGTLRLVFIRVYRLEILSVILVFSTSFANCYPSPLPCVNKYTVYTYTVTTVRKGGGGIWDSGPQPDNTCRKVPL